MRYILYYTQTGNTQAAARKIKEVMEVAEIYNIDDFDTDKLREADMLILGCAAYGDEVLSSEMEEFIKKITYRWNGKKIGLFGTYGGGHGAWMEKWKKSMENLGVKKIESLIVHRDSIDDTDYKGFVDLLKEDTMRYQDERLPEGAVKAGETPIMNQDNVFPGILEKHMAPKEKWGRIVVVKGSLDYVWEDDTENILTADTEHPIIIEPERYHHVILTGDVEFKVEFYKVTGEEVKKSDINAQRPGENFL